MVTEQEYLEVLEQLELCCNAGKPIEDDSVIQVASWDEAYRRSIRLEWINFRTDRSNEFWELGHFEEKWGSVEAFKEIYRPRVPVLREHVYSTVEEKSQYLIFSEEYVEQVTRNLRGTLFAGLLETIYHEHTDAMFHILAAGWVFKGHFPCGYNGKYPEGKLVVY